MISKTHLTDFLELHAKNAPTKAAIITADKQLSWSELDSLADSLAAFLYEQIGYSGAQKVIGLLFPNSWQFVAVYMAILKLGHIAMPLDPTYKQMEQQAVVMQIGPELIITNQTYQASLGKSGATVILFEKIHKPRAAQFKRLALPAERQVASLVFTSGTTGTPKAATYSHANHIWNIKACSEVWNWNKDDTMLLSLPMSKWYGLVMGLSGILYHGNTLYLHDWFDVEATLKTLSSGNITLFTHISSTYSKLLEFEGEYDISKVRLMISGGSALPPPTWEAFKIRFDQEILECYGSSETGRIASNLLNERAPGSPGRILNDVSFKFSEKGEVLIKSPGVFPGYYNNKAATKASFTKDGYWRTGDTGELENGRIILKGRVQERIRRFGYTISPRDVEWALHNNADISEVYVMGQQETGQPNDRLIYFIVGNITKDKVLNYCKINLPFAWRPDEIIILDSIPKNSNGKPRISRLKAMVSGA
jgi:long-chain acyl-CoA synthetase